MTSLRTARLDRGLTQVELSRKTGYSQQHVSSAERGYRRGSEELYRRAAVALGRSVDELRPAA